MIWHIFRKDLQLHWRLAVGAALAQLLLSGMLWKVGSVTGASALAGFGILLILAVFLVRDLLIVEVVHGDALPGVRQDWLVRPISRSELFAAKLLFTVVIGQFPVFIGDLLESLATGFSLGSSFEAALGRSVFLLTAFSLPILAVSAVTRNLLEILTTGVMAFVVMVVASALSGGQGMTAQNLFYTPLRWEVGLLCLFLILVFSSAILTMQFRRRMTIPSRWLAATGGILVAGAFFLHWQQTAFALQGSLSPVPGSARGIEMAFDPSARPVSQGEKRWGVGPNTISLRIPLSVTGMPPDSVMAEDHYDLRLIDSHGVVRATSQSSEYGYDRLLIGRQGAGPVRWLDWPASDLFLNVALDTSNYAQLKDQKLRVELDYSLTLLRLTQSYAIPAINGSGMLPGVGSCVTKANSVGTSINLNCRQAGPPPDCFATFLEHAPSGRRNTESWNCGSRNYAPYPAQFFDALADARSFGMQFHDPTGQNHFPVDAADIADAKLVIRNFRPVDHFTRRITVPARTLSDWLER